MEISSRPEAPVKRYGKNKRATLKVADSSLTYITATTNKTYDLLSVGTVHPTNGIRWHGLSIALTEPAGEILVINGLIADDKQRMLAFLQKARARVWTNEVSPTVSQIYNALLELCNGKRYVDANACLEWLDTYQEQISLIPSVLNRLPIDDNFKKTLDQLETLSQPSNHANYLDQHNNRFIKQEYISYSEFFSGIEANPLTDQQCEAVITDEVNTLIIAGAGTGKTSTLVGKVGYILEKRLALPGEILLLAFTTSAADELRERIGEKFNCDISVRTFHSLGMKILASQGDKPIISKLSDSTAFKKFIENSIKNLANDKRYMKLLMDFLWMYLVPYMDKFHCKNMGQYIAYIRNNDIRSLNGEKVKSYEEAQISNFLLLNGIPYEYEPKYEYDTRTPEFRQYMPDFYLTRDKIYIEHFAVGCDGKPPPYMGIEGCKKYLDSMEWKQGIHEEKGTDLIETFSHQASDGILLDELRKQLEARNVFFKQESEKEFFKRAANENLVTRLSSLLSRFLTLFKASKKSVADLTTDVGSSIDNLRVQAFLTIFKQVFEKYEEHLSAKVEIDYNDMINMSEEYVRIGAYKSPYKYILIDEFQDISWGQYQLVKALKDQRSDVKTVCVGDDWQSIYRFSGADVSIMIDFTDYFGYTKTCLLDKTFRFSQPIVDFSNEFIQRNTNQIEKNLRSQIEDVKDAVSVIFTTAEGAGKEFASVLDRINRKSGSGVTSVFILGRYKHDEPRDLSVFQERFPRLDINFHTMHSSKGMQADYVVIINMGAGQYGFPSEVSDDPLLKLVQVKPDPFPYAEERRLFYVAVTRAKKRVIILADYENQSPFITEITHPDYGVRIIYPDDTQEPIFCPKCKTGRLISKESKHGRFVSCSNFPYCDEKGVRCKECCEGLMISQDGSNIYSCTKEDCDASLPACSECGNIMKQRSSRFGKFYGCSKFPDCKNTLNIS